MYNLAHLYFYEESNIEESIKLLIKSANRYFYPSQVLLCIISIIQFGIDPNIIIKELNNYETISSELSKSIINILKIEKLECIEIFESCFNEQSKINFIYNYNLCVLDFKKYSLIAQNKENETINSFEFD